MKQLVMTAAFLVAVSLAAPSAYALTAVQANAVKKAVTSVAVPEMPAKAAELVAAAAKGDREAVAITAVRAAIYKNRASAAAVVAAVAKVAPEVAPAVTLAATQMERDQVSSIASAAISAAPASRLEVTAAANRGFTAPPTTTAIVNTPASTSVVPQITPMTGGIERGGASGTVIVNVTQDNQPISTTGGNGSGSYTGTGAAPAGNSTPVDYTRPRTL